PPRQAGLLPQVVEVGGMAMRAGAVGAAGRLHLQHAEIHAQLDHLAAVPRLHEPGLGDTGLVFPVLQDEVDVLIHYEILAVRDRGILPSRSSYTFPESIGMVMW